MMTGKHDALDPANGSLARKARERQQLADDCRAATVQVANMAVALRVGTGLAAGEAVETAHDMWKACQRLVWNDAFGPPVEFTKEEIEAFTK
jgi:hypothetical protein